MTASLRWWLRVSSWTRRCSRSPARRARASSTGTPAWRRPKVPGGRANVGFGIQRGERLKVRDMKTLWPDLLERPHVRDILGPAARPEGPHRAWPIPARIDSVNLARGRALFAGDAAAACDPMTGEGIAQALLTGIAAADAVADGGDAANAYTREVRRHLVADHRMSMLLIR